MQLALVVYRMALGCGARKGAVGGVPAVKPKEPDLGPLEEKNIGKTVRDALDALIANMALLLEGKEGKLVMEAGQDITLGGSLLGISWDQAITLFGVGKAVGAFGQHALVPWLEVNTVTGNVIRGGFTTLRGGIGGASAYAGGGGMLGAALGGLILGAVTIGAVYGIDKGLQALGITTAYTPLTDFAPTGHAVMTENLMQIAFTDREVSNITDKLEGRLGPLDTGPSRSRTEMHGIVAEMRQMVERWRPFIPRVGVTPYSGSPTGQYGNPEAQHDSIARLAKVGFTEKNIQSTLGLSDAAWYELKTWDRGQEHYKPWEEEK